jgi:outer membrane protein assembly factor BamB
MVVSRVAAVRRQPLRASIILGAAAFAVLLGSALGALAADWPAWRGPNRDGQCQETGLLKQWPAGGPKLAWKTTGLGEGYSGPAVVGKILYTMGNINGQEGVLAIDVSQRGKVVWASPIGAVRHKGAGYPGPRATPTIEGDRLYTLGINGDLVCMNTRNGQIVWRQDLVAGAGGAIPQWGYSESPLVDGSLVLCTPGGQRATIAAFQKTTGRPAWASPIGDPAGYSSIIKVTMQNVPQYVTLTGKGVVGVQAKDGKPLWRYDRPANGTANISTCVTLGSTVFAASGYGTGGGLAWIKKAGQGLTAEEVYFTKSMKNHHGGFVLLDGYLYGADDPGTLTCLDYKTGEVKWKDRGPGKCSILYADGMLFCRSERGPLTLVEAKPDGYAERGQFDQPDRSETNAWPHPVIADGMLYIRDQDVLLCFDVRAEK